MASQSKLWMGVHGMPDPERLTAPVAAHFRLAYDSVRCVRGSSSLACSKGLRALGCVLKGYLEGENRSDAFHPPTSVSLLVPGPSPRALEPLSPSPQQVRACSSWTSVDLALGISKQGRTGPPTHQHYLSHMLAIPPQSLPWNPGRQMHHDNCMGF